MLFQKIALTNVLMAILKILSFQNVKYAKKNFLIVNNVPKIFVSYAKLITILILLQINVSLIKMNVHQICI